MAKPDIEIGISERDLVVGQIRPQDEAAARTLLEALGGDQGSLIATRIIGTPLNRTRSTTEIVVVTTPTEVRNTLIEALKASLQPRQITSRPASLPKIISGKPLK